MPTLADLVQRTKQLMYGYTVSQQQFTSLTNPVGPTDLALTVADAKLGGTARGIIEIDGNTASAELINLQSVNQATNVATVLPGGRGWAGTTAAAHSANALIENNPVFPVPRVIEALNAGIRSVYPQVFAVGTSKIIKLSVVYEYDLPVEAEEVVSVYFQEIGPDKIQRPMMNYQFNPQSSTTDFPTGKSIYFGQPVTPGREVFVTYKKEPTELVNLSDDFAGVTGLPSTVQDAVVWQACANLSPALEGPRLILNSIEANERAAFVQPGSADKVAQYYQQMAQRALAMESIKQYDRFQQNVHNSF